MLRLSVGGLMLFHGVHKLQHGTGFIGKMLSDAGLPQALSYGVFVGEVIAPLMVVLGIFARPAALVEAFVMVMAVYLVHMGELWALTEHGGYALELQALYFFGSLAIAFLGSGAYSVSRGKGTWD
ncbi:MAG TPA: DoxX family protein [Prosthecochloris aestuarii]|uniref:DoxX family protein n=2 Tax=Prosthecochloris TaxID=1101 RepID=A0A831SRM7_PROAE|nr:DoxX family protein [Prosthecochloris aestuarii]